jgi:FdhD protein
MGSGTVRATWFELGESLQPVHGEIIEEALVTIYVNGKELATIMCTPRDQEDLAIGFLANEGMIDAISDVDHIHLTGDGCCVDIWLGHSVKLPEQRILTSGCGGGVTFQDPSGDIEPIQDGCVIAQDALFHQFNMLQSSGSLYARARGVHSAGLTDGARVLAVAEDVGRHNTIDKLHGACLRRGIDPSGLILIATGRLSSEMLQKTARMGCPIVASRNSPTSLSVKIAEALKITLIGYVRRKGMRVYTHPQRVQPSPEKSAERLSRLVEG